MNSVNLIGRLTRDPDVRYTGSQLAVARFSIAINRMQTKDGEDKGADFPSIVVFGKQAENCERYLSKGKLVGIQGRLHTGSYEKQDGSKVYTTDVIADRVEFLSPNGDNNNSVSEPSNNFEEGFGVIDDSDIPF